MVLAGMRRRKVRAAVTVRGVMVSAEVGRGVQGGHQQFFMWPLRWVPMDVQFGPVL